MARHERGSTTTTGDAAFELAELTTGVHAHGYGQVGDGREFAFRVRSNLVLVEVYRHDAAEVFPRPEDVEATAQCSATDVDLSEERDVEMLVRDLVASASPTGDTGSSSETTVRSFLSRLGSVMDSL